jgi:hypothetical protein
MTDGSVTLPSSMNSSGFAKLEHFVDDFPSSSDFVLLDHLEEEDDQQDCASTLSISSNTFSIYSPEDTTISFSRPSLDKDTNHRMPRHRFVQNLAGSFSKDDRDPSPTTSAVEEGRHRAVHNFTTNIIQQLPSNVNLRQQYENHAVASSKSSKATRGLPHKKSNLALLPVSSSSSLSHQYKIASVPLKKTAIESEVRSFLQRADLESTTKAQVKAHLIKYARLDENDLVAMNFVNDCIEKVTTELLKQPNERRYDQ